jgi:hypothetical protein
VIAHEIKAGDKVRTANGATAVVVHVYRGPQGNPWAEIKWHNGRRKNPWTYGTVRLCELEYLGPAEPTD